jgi:hypothetical protein
MDVKLGQLVTIKNNSIFQGHFNLDEVTGQIVTVDDVSLGDVLITEDGKLTEVDATPIEPLVTDVSRETDERVTMESAPGSYMVDVSTASGLAAAHEAILDAAGDVPADEPTVAETREDLEATFSQVWAKLNDVASQLTALIHVVKIINADHEALKSHVLKPRAELPKVATPKATPAKPKEKLPKTDKGVNGSGKYTPIEL